MGAPSPLQRASDGQPAVTQATVNGWPITWNPDDERFHVQRLDRTSAGTFKELRNARQYAKMHEPV